MQATKAREIQNVVGLTHMQKIMLLETLQYPQYKVYKEQLCFRITGNINEIQFQRCWNAVMKANDILRSTIVWKGRKTPALIIYCDPKNPIEFQSIHNDIDQVCEVHWHTPYDLSLKPLCMTLVTCEDIRKYLLIDYHHILLDGWSVLQMISELLYLYNSNGRVDLVKHSYQEYYEYYLKESANEENRFWPQYLKGYQTKTGIEYDPQTTNYEMAVQSCRLSDSLFKAVYQFIATVPTTMAVFFYFCWAILLRLLLKKDDLVFGITISGRSIPVPGIDKLVGMTISTAPLRVRLRGQSITHLLKKIQEDLIDINQYAISYDAYQTKHVTKELVRNVIVVQNYPNRLHHSSALQPEHVSVSKLHSRKYWNMVALTAGIQLLENHVLVEFSYDQSQITVDVMHKIQKTYCQIMKSLVHCSLEQPIDQFIEDANYFGW